MFHVRKIGNTPWETSMHAAERPPLKKQRLSDQLSSPLVHSPSPVGTPMATTTTERHAGNNRVAGFVSKGGRKSSSVNGSPAGSNTGIEDKENRALEETTEQKKKTPLPSRSSEELSQHNSTQHDSIVLAEESADSLSPVKPAKLGLTASSAADKAGWDEDYQGLGSSQPSFKQLITRFHSITSTVASSRDVSPDLLQEQGYEESEPEGDEEPSTELIVFNNHLSTLKNKYQATINSLQITVHENASTINSLNNQIGDYRNKIENLHLTVQQAQLDSQALADKNDILQDELTILQSKIAKLDKQLVREKSKRAKLTAQIAQLSELLETVFKGYESTHAALSDLRQENNELHNTVAQQETRITSFDDTLKAELESLAQELYIQYAEKHEAKIAKLRAAFESKYAKKQASFKDRFQLLQDQQETLKQELAHVKNRLQVETSEKRQLVKLWDEYVALDKKDVDEMSNFVKRLK